MTESFLKQVPIRLEPSEYEELRRRVLRRDGWRCQFCGSRQNLQLHHQQYRSHSGEDTEANLITLCENCHSLAHRTVTGRSDPTSMDCS
jgi:5-methylcytosine-specific restriction endonuclease McrA